MQSNALRRTFVTKWQSFAKSPSCLCSPRLPSTSHTNRLTPTGVTVPLGSPQSQSRSSSGATQPSLATVRPTVVPSEVVATLDDSFDADFVDLLPCDRCRRAERDADRLTSQKLGRHQRHACSTPLRLMSSHELSPHRPHGASRSPMHALCEGWRTWV